MVSYLRFKHPGIVHTPITLCFFEGVCRVNWDTVFGVVQGYISGFVSVALADLLESARSEASWWSAHIQRVLASLNMVEVLNYGCSSPLFREQYYDGMGQKDDGGTHFSQRCFSAVLLSASLIE